MRKRKVMTRQCNIKPINELTEVAVEGELKKNAEFKVSETFK
jgi:hypothetical protein